MTKDLKKRINKVLITLKPEGTVTTALNNKE